MSRIRWRSGLAEGLRFVVIVVLLAITTPWLYAQGDADFDAYNFISTTDDVGVTLTKHLSLNAGYQLGTRLNVNVDEKKDRFGLSLTQKGPIVGMQVSF